MPISLEQWRAQIGLIYAASMPRALKALKGRKSRRIKWSLSPLCLALVQILLRMIVDAIDTGQHLPLKIASWCKTQLSSPGAFQSLPTHSNGGKKGLSLLLTCLMIVQMLLIIAGDVEQNPGPRTKQVSRLGIDDLLSVKHELVNIDRKWCEIGLELGLHPDALEDIKHQELNLSSRSTEMLTQWLKGVDPLPTWEALATALDSQTVRERHLAQQLRKKYCQLQETDRNQEEGASTQESQFAHHPMKHLGHPVKHSAMHKASTSEKVPHLPPITSVHGKKPSIVASQPDSHSLQLPKVSSGKLPCLVSCRSKEHVAVASHHSLPIQRSGKQNEATSLEISTLVEPTAQDEKHVCMPALAWHKHQDLKQSNDGLTVLTKIKNFESKFDKLSFAVRREMEKHHVSPKRFQHSLIQLPESIRNDHLQFLRENLSDIMKAKSIEKLFVYLNLYWNFLDYDLLEHIIERFGSDRLKEKMAEYVQDLARFRRTTKVSQFIKFWPGRAEPPPHFSEVKIKLEKNVMEYTLEELEQLRRNFCIEFRFKPFMLMLATTKKGSITIVWHIPSVLTSQLQLTDATLSFFEYYQIVELEVNKKYVLHRQQKNIQMLQEGSEKQTRLEQQIQHLKDERQELKAEFQATLEQREAQLDLERRERANLKQQLETKQREELKQTGEDHEVQEDRERLLQALKQSNAQIDTDEREKEHLQQRIEQLEVQLQKEKEITKQQLQHEKEKQEMLATLEQREFQLDWERREREKLEQQVKTNQKETEKLLEALSQRRAQIYTDRREKEHLQQRIGQLEVQLQKENELTKQQLQELEELMAVSKLREAQLNWERRQREDPEKQVKTNQRELQEDHKEPGVTHEKDPQAQLPEWCHNLKDTELPLHDIVISDEEAHAFAENLRENQTLEELELQNIKISDEGFTAVANGLQDNKSLKWLRLRDITISDEGISAVASALQDNKSLKTMNFFHVEISDKGASELASALKANQILEKLELWEDTVSEEGFTAIASALKENKGLKTVYVRRTKISDSGAKALASALQVNNTLEELVLFNITMSDVGFSAFASGLQDNKNLKQLNFRLTKISDSGAKALASALEMNKTLDQLVLSLTKVPDSGTRELAGALRVNQTLEHLEVDFESVSEEGAREFAAAVEVNSSLSLLKIWRSRHISEEALGLLKETAIKKRIRLTFAD